MRVTFPQLSKSKLSEKHQKLLPWAAVSVLILLLATAAGFFYWRYRSEVLLNPAYEVKQIVKELEKIIELPQGVVPTLATVTEKEKLQQEGFFKNAENGDKVLIYLSEGKAILYRPSHKKIIDVAPVQKQAETTAVQSPTPEAENKELSVAIFNGTSTSGLTKIIETDLAAVPLNLSVSRRENASAANYTKTLIVDLNGELAREAKLLADALSGEVSGLPEGEKNPGTDLLIIAGKPVTPIPSPSPTVSP